MTMTYAGGQGEWLTTITYVGPRPVPESCADDAHDWTAQAPPTELPEEVEEMPGAKWMQMQICKTCHWQRCRITVEKP